MIKFSSHTQSWSSICLQLGSRENSSLLKADPSAIYQIHVSIVSSQWALPFLSPPKDPGLVSHPDLHHQEASSHLKFFAYTRASLHWPTLTKHGDQLELPPNSPDTTIAARRLSVARSTSSWPLFPIRQAAYLTYHTSIFHFDSLSCTRP